MRTLWYNITMIIIVILYHSKGDSCMPGINYWAVVVAAVAAFVASAAGYILFGKELTKVSAAFSKGMQKPPPWKIVGVIVTRLRLALGLAYFSAPIRNLHS